MTIVDLRQEPMVDWVGHILDNYPFLPYWWVRRVTQESRQAMMEREMEQAVANSQAHCLGCIEGDGLVGFAQMHRLDWDSKHFGVEVYRLDRLGVWGKADRVRERAGQLVQAVVERARESGASTLQTWVPTDDIAVIHVLEAAGFRTMDILVTWVFDFEKTPVPDYHLERRAKVRGHKPGDEGPLTRLASWANSRHMPNRFQADPHLSVEACDELYRQWMLNSISADLADHISVVEFEGEVVGYSSLKYLGDRDGLCNLRLSQLLLGAVVPGLRRRGLATQALIHNLKWLEDKTDIVHVGTQVNNIAAQRVWANLGFRPARTGPSMHVWLDR